MNIPIEDYHIILKHELLMDVEDDLQLVLDRSIIAKLTV